MIFLAFVAADCEWKEKEITVQEGEAVRFSTVFDIDIIDIMIVTNVALPQWQSSSLSS